MNEPFLKAVLFTERERVATASNAALSNFERLFDGFLLQVMHVRRILQYNPNVSIWDFKIQNEKPLASKYNYPAAASGQAAT